MIIKTQYYIMNMWWKYAKIVSMIKSVFHDLKIYSWEYEFEILIFSFFLQALKKWLN